jgi:hypothetical protein
MKPKTQKNSFGRNQIQEHKYTIYTHLQRSFLIFRKSQRIRDPSQSIWESTLKRDLADQRNNGVETSRRGIVHGRGVQPFEGSLTSTVFIYLSLSIRSLFHSYAQFSSSQRVVYYVHLSIHPSTHTVHNTTYIV